MYVVDETPEQVEQIKRAEQRAPIMNDVVLDAMEAAGMVRRNHSKPYYCGEMKIMFCWWIYIKNQPRMVRWMVGAVFLANAPDERLREIAAQNVPEVLYTLEHGEQLNQPAPPPSPANAPAEPQPPKQELKQLKLF